MSQKADVRTRRRFTVSLCALGLAYVSLLAFNSLARTRNFTEDSMNYVDVARNVVAGKGISQTTLGFNQPDLPWDGPSPSAMVSQAPLFPLLIAFVSATGITCADAALLIPVFSLAAVLALAWFVARILYDERTALVSVFLLLVYHPLALTAGFAWSETTAIASVLLTLLFLAGGCDGRGAVLRAAAAGVAAGMGFSLRYALFPLVPLVIIFLAFEGVARRRSLLPGLFCAVGAAVPVCLVAGRNLRLSGACIPAGRPSDIGLLANAEAVARTLMGSYLGMLGETVEIVLLLAVLCGVFVLLYRRGALRATVVDVLFGRRRWLLIAWFASYVVFLVVQRSRTHFDPLGPRLLAPAGVVGVLLCAALVVRAVRLSARHLRWLLLAGLCVSLAREAAYAVLWEPVSDRDRAEKSERLSWIAANTRKTDLIIGDNMVDVPFYVGRSGVLSFSPYPYTDHPTLDLLRAAVLVHGAKGGRVCLVLRRMSWNKEETREAYGDFIADITVGRTDFGGTIVRIAELADASVFVVKTNR
ncbi:MAG: glycosyltransferase family 39 protein [Lentisphaerae bacterium]|nr:glycosyltransferase family 39 protein [Lentisphaerota bacterium]